MRCRPTRSACWPTVATAARCSGWAWWCWSLSDLALAFVGGLAGLALGVVLWGLHMGMTQGLLAALVADAAPANLRGTAYGLFNLVSGLALLVASVVAGGLWDAFGSRATFLAGAGFAIVALLALVPVARRVRRNSAVQR